MLQKLRLRFLHKLAQTPAPTDLPTDQVSKTTTVSGSPPSFVASEWYPDIRIAFQSKNVPWIDNLANLINTALFYSSNGKVTLSWMRSNNFNYATDQAPSIELKNLMMYSQVLYKTIFTNMGQPYTQPLTPDDIKKKIDFLYNHQVLTNLPATNASGQLATKIGGNVKDLIKSYLQQIK